MKRLCVGWLAGWMGLCWTFPVLGQERPKVAVFMIQDEYRKLSAELRTELTGFLRAHLPKDNHFSVVPEAKVTEALALMKKAPDAEPALESNKVLDVLLKDSPSNCDWPCLTELGQRLSSSKALVARIGRIGDLCKIKAVLVDLRSREVDCITLSLAGCEVEKLKKSLQETVKQLDVWARAASSPVQAAPPGSVKVELGDFAEFESGSRNQAEVRTVLQGRLGGARACYKKRLMQVPGLAGMLLLRFQIHSSGRLFELEVLENTTQDSVLGDCVKLLVSRIRFQYLPGEETFVALPYLFGQGGK